MCRETDFGFVISVCYLVLEHILSRFQIVRYLHLSDGYPSACKSGLRSRQVFYRSQLRLRSRYLTLTPTQTPTPGPTPAWLERITLCGSMQKHPYVMHLIVVQMNMQIAGWRQLCNMVGRFSCIKRIIDLKYVSKNIRISCPSFHY